jgi:hypothetical protein
VEWDGIGKEGTPLEVGFDYAYSLSIVDEAGNPQRYSGKPFSIQAFRYARSGNTVTAINPDLLFSDASSVKFSPAGNRAMTEVKDFLRTRYTSGIEIIVYELDEKFAQARASAVQKYLSSEMEYAEGRIKTSGLSLNKKKGYRHVEIITK